MLKHILSFLLLTGFYWSSDAQHQIGVSTNSVLAKGQWFKLSTVGSGVYKLHASSIKGMGIDLNSINTNKIGIFANYGGMVPDYIKDNKTSDLFELPIKIVGGSDNKFDDNDYILFYAEGADKWVYDASNHQFDYLKNIYDQSNYCYFTIDQGTAKPIIESSIGNISPTRSTNEYYDNQVYEVDEVNLLGSSGNVNTQGSGKLWFGNNFGANINLSTTSNFDFSGWVSNQEIHIRSTVAARSDRSGSLSLQVGDKEITKNVGLTHVSDIETNYARLIKIDEFHNLSLNQNSTVSLTYNNTSSQAKSWLDQIIISGKRSLRYNNDQIQLVDLESADHYCSEFKFQPNTSEEVLVWDISDIKNTTSVTITNGSFKYLPESNIKRFAMFRDQDAYAVQVVGQIENQNLHSIEDLDYLIVYHKEFEEAANKLASHRNSHDGLNVMTVNVQKIYNEFSSGKFDPSAIRNFAKMLYDRSPSFKYLALIGDGSYDQRQIFNKSEKLPFLPLFETEESIHPVESFPSDDFFALLSDNEGGNLVGRLDIAVGRIPVKSKKEANSTVDKLIRYDISPDRFGPWRSDMGFIADDEDNNLHLNQTERISSMTEEKYPFININKTYFDAYIQESTPGGQRYPEANKAIKDNIFKGQLALCYLGHGGRNGISQERVLQIPDIKAFQNPDKPTLLITATCSLTGYDNHDFVSAGEEAFLKPFGGAIALFTTVRAVYSSSNERLTREVFENIYNKEYDKSLRFGDIIVDAKNSNASDTLRTNARKFTLIGDPAQRIALPEYKVNVVEINDTPANTFTDTLGAFEKIKIKGVIADYLDRNITDFNGTVNVKFYDKKTVIETRANDVKSQKIKFEQYKNLLFSGQASVTNGVFELEFTIPLDINYSIGNTKLSMYAWSDTKDALGNYNKVIVGGIGDSPIVDDLAPQMDIYINNTSFRSGGISNTNPNLLVQLADDFGINITGNSIGHDVTAKLEGQNLSKTFTLNEHFVSEKDDYTKGSIVFPLGDLSVGEYKVIVKAWDLGNNSTTDTLGFKVVEDGFDEIIKIYNFPNPVTTMTNFNYEYNLGYSSVLTQINIFDLNGRLIKTLSENTINDGNANRMMSWDTSDENGQKVASGVYFYKIKLEDTALGRELESKFHKLILF